MTTTATQRAVPQARFAVWRTPGGWHCPVCHGRLKHRKDGAETAGHTFRVVWHCGCGKWSRLWIDTDAPERVVGHG